MPEVSQLEGLLAGDDAFAGWDRAARALSIVVLPTCRQYTPCLRGPDLGVRRGAGSYARVIAVACRLTSGVHPTAERGPALRRVHRAIVVWSGSVLRTKVHDAGVRAPGGPACVPGWCSAIGWTPQSMPGPCRPVLGCPQGGRIPCGRGAGVRCPCRGMRPAHPRIPPPGSRRAPGLNELRCYFKSRLTCAALRSAQVSGRYSARSSSAMAAPSLRIRFGSSCRKATRSSGSGAL